MPDDNLSAPAPKHSFSWLNWALWSVPLVLLAAVVYVFAAALQSPAGTGSQASNPGRGREKSAPLPAGQALPARPMRILPADCGMADILAALVEPQRLAAVPATVDGYAGAKEYWAEHREIPRFERFQAETLLSLKPDLILAVIYRENAAADVLERQGVPVLRFEHFRSFAGIRDSFLTVGQAVGEEQKARALVDDFDKRLAAVEKAVAGRPTPRALWYSKYDQGFTVGAGESQDEILRRAGARNAAAELGLAGHVHFTFEQLLRLRPDYLVVSGEDLLASPQARIVLNEPVLAELPAVKERRIAVVPDRYASAVSQYIVDAVEILARQLHPEAFRKTVSVQSPSRARKPAAMGSAASRAMGGMGRMGPMGPLPYGCGSETE
ncbi:MAG: ABC transporter substrate-binding protein [Planctomycetota bacterium]